MSEKKLIQCISVETQEYMVIGVSGRNAMLVSPPPHFFSDDPPNALDVALGAQIVATFLKQEISPQMLGVVLTMLYRQGEPYADRIIKMLQETVTVQKEFIRSLRPPQRIIEMAEAQYSWLEENEEGLHELGDWLRAVTVEMRVDEGEPEGGEDGEETGKDAS